MNRVEIIPAMDIIDGKCVRLKMGDYLSKTEYTYSPLEQAIKFEEWGFKSLHLVDLDGAKGSGPVNLSILKAIASKTSLKIEFGGGVKSIEAARTLLSAGVERVVVGSLSVTNPKVVIKMVEEFGEDKVVLGVDIMDGKIAINGWVDKVVSDVNLFISNYVSQGIRRIVCTDISKDGMMSGPSVDLYIKLINNFPELDITASGGVSSINDLELLSKIEIRRAIVGKALYEGQITEKDIRRWLQNE